MFDKIFLDANILLDIFDESRIAHATSQQSLEFCLKNDKQLVGKLLAFDIHINIILENAKEVENGEVKKNLGLTFVRGDTIVFISPASV